MCCSAIAAKLTIIIIINTKILYKVLSNAVRIGRLIEAVRIDDVLRSMFFLDSREISLYWIP